MSNEDPLRVAPPGSGSSEPVGSAASGSAASSAGGSDPAVDRGPAAVPNGATGEGRGSKPAPNLDASTLGEDDEPPASGSLRSGGRAPPRRELERGESFGRYVVVSRLGQGGMSVVYVAYDPELDRKVALKLLIERREDGAVARTRLVREAQALAKLAHPNVVAVHDVGTVDGRVYLAMELVEGRTLDAWLAEASRGWAQVLAVFVPAGQGLAAAHAAGLVHRDFKPENVMLGDDGRVRVMDFGLARAERTPAPGDATAGAAASEVLAAPLTRTGALLGTPRYMAPEQWRGEPTDPRSDQFSYCVSLWEALHGAPPFVGKTIGELAEQVLRGDVRGPTRPGVPAWLRRIVRRGLSVDPAQRWPSMQALLEAFARGRARERIRRRARSLGAVALVALGVVAWDRWRVHQRAQACERAGEEIARVWNDGARTALHDALAGTGAGLAESVFEHTVPWIDAWTARWAEVRTQVCMEAEVEGTRSPDLHARASECLEERRDELAGLLAVLGEGDRSVLSQATLAASRLSRLEPCADPAALARRPPAPDPAQRDEVVTLRRELLRIHGLHVAGLRGSGLAAAEDVLVRAQALGYEPLVAWAWAMVGSQALGASKLERAETAFLHAFSEAGARGNDDRAALAAVNLVNLHGVGRERASEALVWAEAATMLVRRIGEEDGLVGAFLHQSLAELHVLRGDHPAGRDHAQRALDIIDAVLGSEHPAAAPVLAILGRAHMAASEPALGRAAFERALAVQEATMGPAHPSVSDYLSMVATARTHQGEVDEALALYERALAIQEAHYGPDDLFVAIVLNQLGNALMRKGDPAGALPRLERALAILEAKMGAAHPNVGRVLINLADAHAQLGRVDRAKVLLERAVAQLETALGPAHPHVGLAREALRKLSG